MKTNNSVISLTVTLLIAISTFGCVAKREVNQTKVLSVLDREGTKLSDNMKIEIAETVLQLSREYQMDPMLILAVMKVESTFNPKAVSNAQAYGLMQVRAIVVKDVAGELGINPQDEGKLLTSHHFNLRVGVHYLAKLLKKFKGDLHKALMAYNAGPTTVAKLYKNRPAPEGGYQGRVLKAYEKLSAS